MRNYAYIARVGDILGVWSNIYSIFNSLFIFFQSNLTIKQCPMWLRSILQSLGILKKHIIPTWKILVTSKGSFNTRMIQTFLLFFLLVLSNLKYMLCWGGAEEIELKGKVIKVVHAHAITI
jgi:hypothetical protein